MSSFNYQARIIYNSLSWKFTAKVKIIQYRITRELHDPYIFRLSLHPVMWSRDQGLRLETIPRPENLGLGFGLGLVTLGLCLGNGLGLDLGQY